MKIINNKNNTIFGGLNLGDIFKFPDGKSVYMKTTETDIVGSPLWFKSFKYKEN